MRQVVFFSLSNLMPPLLILLLLFFFLHAAANARGSTRVFTVGIGGADPVLVKELARAGNGRSDLVELGGSGLSSVVVSQLKAAQVVALTDCSLEVPPFASCAQQTIPPFFRCVFVLFFLCHSRTQLGKQCTHMHTHSLSPLPHTARTRATSLSSSLMGWRIPSR